MSGLISCVQKKENVMFDVSNIILIKRDANY